MIIIFYYSYSEEIFSQQSRRHSNETNSSATDQEDDLSDGENLSAKYSSHSSPRHKSKNVIYSNTTHLKLTPTEIDEKTKSLNIHGPFGDAGNEVSSSHIYMSYYTLNYFIYYISLAIKQH